MGFFFEGECDNFIETKVNVTPQKYNKIHIYTYYPHKSKRAEMVSC